VTEKLRDQFAPRDRSGQSKKRSPPRAEAQHRVHPRTYSLARYLPAGCARMSKGILHAAPFRTWRRRAVRNGAARRSGFNRRHSERRAWLRAGSTSRGAGACATLCTPAQRDAARVAALRPKIVDPVWTTACHREPRLHISTRCSRSTSSLPSSPQMVDRTTLGRQADLDLQAADGSNGTRAPGTAEDCIASLKVGRARRHGRSSCRMCCAWPPGPKTIR